MLAHLAKTAKQRTDLEKAKNHKGKKCRSNQNQRKITRSVIKSTSFALHSNQFVIMDEFGKTWQSKGDFAIGFADDIALPQ